ncbi:MAG: cysteine synthase A [Candidatus Bathyarchaeia archaeon]
MDMRANICDLIGNTPLMKLNISHEGEDFEILAKLEFMNPSGSVKDRIAKYIIEQAERSGILRKGDTIVEATSGNTGIALSMVAAAKGYKMLVLMPEHMSRERVRIMQDLGADICLTPKELGFEGAVKRAKEIAERNRGFFYANQFGNPMNVMAHYHYTGREIAQQAGRRIDLFVAGVGTGGTIMGVGRFLRELNSGIKLIAVEPEECAVLAAAKAGRRAELRDHKIPGIGDGFVPEIVNLNEIDDVITVKSDDAIAMASRLNKEHGLMVGISSGANVLATIRALKAYGRDKIAATVLPDRVERYFSTELFSEEYIRSALRACKLDRECLFLL